MESHVGSHLTSMGIIVAPVSQAEACCDATGALPSSWATKVSTIGQQGLFGAEGAEESQGHKALGIHRPCLGPVRAQRKDLLRFTLEQQGFEVHARAAREHCVEHFGSGLGSGKALFKPGPWPWPSPTKRFTWTSRARQSCHENHRSARPLE